MNPNFIVHSAAGISGSSLLTGSSGAIQIAEKNLSNPESISLSGNLPSFSPLTFAFRPGPTGCAPFHPPAWMENLWIRQSFQFNHPRRTQE